MKVIAAAEMASEGGQSGELRSCVAEGRLVGETDARTHLGQMGGREQALQLRSIGWLPSAQSTPPDLPIRMRLEESGIQLDGSG